MAKNDYRATERTKQVGIKHRAKIHTEACYFTMENWVHIVLTKTEIN